MFSAKILSDTDLGRGYRLTRMDRPSAPQPKDLLFCETREQTICAEDQAYRIRTETRSLDNPHILGSVSQTDDFLAPVPHVEELLEEKVTKAVQTGIVGNHVVCEADTEERRQVLGLPRLPLSTQSDASGGNPSVAYLSLSESCEGFHKQALNLQSVRVVWRGSPRVWVVVAPRHSEKLEAFFVSRGNRIPQCSQFITHEGMIVPPSTLRRLNISFSTFVQNPGDLVWTDYRVYCYYWNLGRNVVEETPWCETDWWYPPFYQPCQPDMICGKPRIRPTSPMAKARDHPLSSVVDFNTLDSPRSEKSIQQMSHRPKPTNNSSGLENTSPKSSAYPSTSSAGSPDSVGTDFAISADRPSQRRLPKGQQFPLIYEFDGNSEQSTADSMQEQGQRASGRPCAVANINDCETQSSGSAIHPESSTATPSPATPSPATPSPATPSPVVSDPVVPSPAVTISSEAWQPMPVDIPSAKEGQDLVAADRLGVQALNRNGAMPSSPHSSRMQMELNEIENLIRLGIEYEKHVIWPFNKSPQSVKKMLTRFKPFQGQSSWLNDECILQVLAYLTRDRDDVLIVDPMQVATALNSGDGKNLIVSSEGVNVVFIPVMQQSHWFLVSFEVGTRNVIVHESEKTGYYAGYFFLQIATEAYPGPPWILRNENIHYMYPSQNTMEDCGIRLLGEARRISMRRPVEIIDTITLRRMFLSFLLHFVKQENQTVQLMSNLRLNFPTSTSSQAHLQIPVVLSVDEEGNDVQGGEEGYLDNLASAVGCSDVLTDLKNISSILKLPPSGAVSRLDMAMQMYTLGDASGILGYLQKDLAASFVANRYSEILKSVRARLGKSGKTKQGKRGRGMDSPAWDQLEQEWNQPQMSSTLRKHLQYVNSRGQKLLSVNRMCAGRPLWMFFPARKMAAPADPTFFVTPFM